MEPYHIKHQHQEAVNHTKYSFANCFWLHTRYKHSISTRRNQVLPMDTHLKLHANKLKQLTQTQTHSLHDLNAYSDPHRKHKSHNLS